MPGQSRILLNQTASNSASRPNNNRRNSISNEVDIEINNFNINQENNEYDDHRYDILPTLNTLNNAGEGGGGVIGSPESNTRDLNSTTADICDEPLTEGEGETEGEGVSINTNTPLVKKRPEAKNKRATPHKKPTQSLPQNWHRTHREPGVNPHKVDLPSLQAKVVLQIADYSSTQAEFNVLTNSTLSQFLEKPRPAWGKVRWIHVNGLDWNVIKLLGIKFDLHPLSLEDMLNHGTSSTRSKADYYRQHLFVSVVVHKTLAESFYEEQEHSSTASASSSKIHPLPPSNLHLREQLGFHSRNVDEESATEGRNLAKSFSVGDNFARLQRDECEEVFGPDLREAFMGSEKDKNKEDVRILSSNTPGLFKSSDKSPAQYHSGSKRTSKSSHEASRYTVAALTKDVKIHINIEQLSIFLLRDGTVLSFTQDTGYHGRFSNIFNRISNGESLLRESEDAGFILQALLDTVGDHQLDIVDAFRQEITNLEASVLAKPDMTDVRHLHVLSAQLLLLKSNITPFQQLLHNLRTQDDAKAAASIKPNLDRRTTESSTILGVGGVVRTSGFLSHEVKIYFSDILDHTESVLSSLDLFSSLTENLIAFTFNNLSYSSNSFIQALSVLSVIFLPLTFLSGFFGMNFTDFPELNHDTTYFWSIAGPTALLTTIVFSWSYFVELGKEGRRVGLGVLHGFLARREEKEGREKVH